MQLAAQQQQLQLANVMSALYKAAHVLHCITLSTQTELLCLTRLLCCHIFQHDII